VAMNVEVVRRRGAFTLIVDKKRNGKCWGFELLGKTLKKVLNTNATYNIYEVPSMTLLVRGMLGFIKC